MKYTEASYQDLRDAMQSLDWKTTAPDAAAPPTQTPRRPLILDGMSAADLREIAAQLVAALGARLESEDINGEH